VLLRVKNGGIAAGVAALECTPTPLVQHAAAGLASSARRLARLEGADALRTSPLPNPLWAYGSLIVVRHYVTTPTAQFGLARRRLCGLCATLRHLASVLEAGVAAGFLGAAAHPNVKPLLSDNRSSVDGAPVRGAGQLEELPCDRVSQSEPRMLLHPLSRGVSWAEHGPTVPLAESWPAP
jgi:hypothetical protein